MAASSDTDCHDQELELIRIILEAKLVDTNNINEHSATYTVDYITNLSQQLKEHDLCLISRWKAVIGGGGAMALHKRGH